MPRTHQSPRRLADGRRPAPPRAPPARAERLPGRGRPGGRQGRSLPGPGVGCHRQRRTDQAGALVPWICDALLSNHSVKAYGRDLMDFLRHMQAQGVDTAGGHRRPREALQAGAAGSRPDVGHGGTAAVGHPRHLQGAGGQGAGAPGRRPRTSLRSRPPACRRTPHRP